MQRQQWDACQESLAGLVLRRLARRAAAGASQGQRPTLAPDAAPQAPPAAWSATCRWQL